MAFYKLYCLVYRRTDYFKLDRMRRKLMYPEYYIEQDMRTKDKLMSINLINTMIAININNSLNHERW